MLRTVLLTAITAGVVVGGSVAVDADQRIDRRRDRNLVRQDVVVGALDSKKIDKGSDTVTQEDQTAGLDYRLTLGEQTFDPLMMAPRPPVGWEMPEHAGADLRLVQFHGPIQQTWLDGLEEAGLEIIQYIHPYTYIVWGKAGQLEAVAGDATVRWAGQFTPDFRCLKRDLPADVVDVSVLLYRGANTNQTVRQLHALGAVKNGREIINNRFEIANYKMPGTLFQEAVRVPGVYSLQVKPKDGGLRAEINCQIAANNVDGSNFAFPGYLDWLSGTLGYDGEGIIMANVDGGVDQDHPDLSGRFLSCVGDSCGGSACSGHGTHTAGAMSGTGASGTNAGGFLRGLGMAPGASLIEQLYSPTFTEPNGMLKLITESNDNGAVLSSNSWGPSGSPQGYDGDTMQCDQGALDADPDTAGNQEFLYVLAFMNGNGGTSSQGSPDEAKNIFTIGSTKVLSSGSQDPNIDDLSSNTAHGPALDGRQLPHMVTGGCSTDGPTCSGGYSNGYCGTSMACPQAAGACALFYYYYRTLDLESAVPSPAMVKAAMCVAAHDLEGNEDADGNTLGHRPDSKQGYGRLNVPRALMQPADSVRYYDNPVVFDNTDESWSVTVTPLNDNEPMRIMLAWSDAVGHGLGGSTPAWNNDLDLVVTAGSNTYFGNRIGGGGWSNPGGSRDSINNMEAVYLGPGAPGSATITVEATNINSDGILNSGDTTDQSFSLVCQNCAAEPGFSLAVTPSSSDVCGANTSEVILSVDVAQVLGFSDPVILATTGLPSGSSATFADNPVIPGSTTSLTISGLDSVTSGLYPFTVDGVSGSLIKSASSSLQVEANAPGVVSLVSPADGETGVSMAPELSWGADASAASYTVEVSLSSNFSSTVFSETNLESPSVDVSPGLETATRYYWRVRGTNACGDSGWSDISDFETADLPAILLVDDDDNSPDVRSYYTNTLDAMGAAYDLWDTDNTDDEPSANELAGYDLVLWFTGDEYGGFCGPDSASESAIMTYLDGGGCFFISSQDYMWDRGGDSSDPTPTTLMADYLGVGSAENDVGQTSVSGEGIFDSIGSTVLDYPITNWSDVISAGGSGGSAFDGNEGNAGTYLSNETFTGVYLGFPLEAIPGLEDRIAILHVIFDLCQSSEPCPADFDLDGSVNIGDFSMFLVAFGTDDLTFDLDNDGTVGIGDFSQFLIVFNTVCP